MCWKAGKATITNVGVAGYAFASLAYNRDSSSAIFAAGSEVGQWDSYFGPRNLTNVVPLQIVDITAGADGFTAWLATTNGGVHSVTLATALTPGPLRVGAPIAAPGAVAVRTMPDGTFVLALTPTRVLAIDPLVARVVADIPIPHAQLQRIEFDGTGGILVSDNGNRVLQVLR